MCYEKYEYTLAELWTDSRKENEKEWAGVGELRAPVAKAVLLPTHTPPPPTLTHPRSATRAPPEVREWRAATARAACRMPTVRLRYRIL